MRRSGGADVTASAPRRLAPWLVILGGVCAALHVGKLPPALAALQHALGLSLVQAGFLLSAVQLAGMCAGLAFGAFADALGGKRSMILGLLVLALASALGGGVQAVAPLLALRALEGLGFLLAVLPAPGLVRRFVDPGRTALMLGVWGAYMPFGTALALLAGPVWIGAWGWRSWWTMLAVLSLAMAAGLALALPAAGAATAAADAGPPPALASRLAQTLAAAAPWRVALCFAAYSSQWLAVIGFLPTIYLQAGVGGAATGALTALAAAANIAGNLAAGRLLHAGVPAARLLATGFVVMALATLAAYGGEGALPAWARYVAVLAFSTLGGLVPATLFALAVRAAPSEHTVATTVGWVQQWSALGQFAGPPLVAWMASRAGGWQWTWVVTGALALAGLALARPAAATPSAPRPPETPRR